jgi:hypothetical protein
VNSDTLARIERAAAHACLDSLICCHLVDSRQSKATKEGLTWTIASFVSLSSYYIYIYMVCFSFSAFLRLEKIEWNGMLNQTVPLSTSLLIPPPARRRYTPFKLAHSLSPASPSLNPNASPYLSSSSAHRSAGKRCLTGSFSAPLPRRVDPLRVVAPPWLPPHRRSLMSFVARGRSRRSLPALELVASRA